MQQGQVDVLVVDDNAENLMGIEAALRGIAHLVTARSGRDALRQLLRREFAAVLLDVQMPGLSGIDTAKLIRGRPRSSHLPIIFVTAYSHDDALVREAYRLGAVDFLFKPISSEVLRAKVSVFVELQRRSEELARQAVLLRESDRARHRHQLEQQRHQLEEIALRSRIEAQEKAAAALAQRARELARTVAERERAERQLREINEQLEDADRAKDEFLAILAHELRNPLTPLAAGVEILQTADLPNLDRTCQAMHRQVWHLVRLVDDLLDISRVNTRSIELRKEPLSLATVIEQAVDQTRPLLSDRGHELSIRAAEPVPWVEGDEVRLTQVVGNLLSNAIRYTEPPGHIEVVATIADECARIEVRDDGRGLTEEECRSAFELFSGRDSKGLGIGLALARSLVEQHGGTLSATSPGPGRGSVFTVELPAYRQPEESAPVARASRGQGALPNDSRGPLRVAIIDDDDDVRETTCELLSIWGYSVESARTGAAGIDLVVSMKPDVAIVDIGLPDVDGYEVARSIRVALNSQTPRLVALSGYAQPDDRKRSAAAGFDEHLAKPPDGEVLRNALHGGQT